MRKTLLALLALFILGGNAFAVELGTAGPCTAKPNHYGFPTNCACKVGEYNGVTGKCALTESWEDVSQLVRACYEEMRVQISIQLAQEWHGLPEGSPEEQAALEKIAQFNDRVANYNASENGCNVQFSGDYKFACSIGAYTPEINSLIADYSVDYVRETFPACNYVYFP